MFTKSVGDSIRRSNLKNGKHHPTADTAAVVTLAASAGLQHVIHHIQWSYSTDPTGGLLTISVNAVTVWQVTITSSGPGGFNFPIAGGTNEAVVVTLAAGSGACVGKVNVQYSTEPEKAL